MWKAALRKSLLGVSRLFDKLFAYAQGGLRGPSSCDVRFPPFALLPRPGSRVPSGSYGYDAAGNRDTGSDTVTTGNEMTADANWDYKYDKEGELTEKDSTVVGSSEKWTYAWSANGNLDEVKHYNSSGTLVLDVTYEYDAFGEMIQKSDGTVRRATPRTAGTATWRRRPATRT